MAIDRVNLGTSTVLTAPSPATTGTSLVVQSGDGADFPRTTFRAIAHPDGTLPTRDNAEIIDVTTIATDTFTIVRARDGTTARSIAVGWRVSAIIDAGHVTENAGLFQNALINGGFDIWQRNTTFTPTDDIYIADRWNVLVETDLSWTIIRDTDVPNIGSTYSFKGTQTAANNNQCAIVQFLENKDTVPLDDGYVSLSFWAKTSGTEIANLRAVILTWAGTADSVTSDVIGTWASDGTNPTWATSWTAESTPENFALTGTWTEFKVENVAIDTATVNNLAVVIWVDDGTIAANDDFWVTQVQLNQGRFAVPYQPRHFAHELELCKRYYEKSYEYQTFAAAVTGVGAIFYATDNDATAGSARHCVLFKTEKRILPTITIYGIGGTSGQISDDATDRAISGGAASTNVSSVGFDQDFTLTSPANQYRRCHYVANAEL